MCYRCWITAADAEEHRGKYLTATMLKYSAAGLLRLSAISVRNFTNHLYIGIILYDYSTRFIGMRYYLSWYIFHTPIHIVYLYYLNMCDFCISYIYINKVHRNKQINNLNTAWSLIMIHNLRQLRTDDLEFDSGFFTM